MPKKVKSFQTGTNAFIMFFIIAIATWFILSDPRGPIGAFPYPFVMYLAIMILVGLWQHLSFNNWPFGKMKQPSQGIMLTIMNVVLTFFVIHIIFYSFIG